MVMPGRCSARPSSRQRSYTANTVGSNSKPCRLIYMRRRVGARFRSQFPNNAKKILAMRSRSPSTVVATLCVQRITECPTDGTRFALSPVARHTMQACNRLRIDLDGSPAVDFRIEHGRVEQRIVEMAELGIEEKEWRPLTSEQLSSHVLANTVVARWLCRRMGIFGLMRACNQSSLWASYPLEQSPDMAA